MKFTGLRAKFRQLRQTLADRRNSFEVNGWGYTYTPVEGGIGLMITDLRGRPLGKPELISRPRLHEPKP